MPAERFGPGVGPHRGRIPAWLLARCRPVGELCDVGSLSFALGSEVARIRAGLGWCCDRAWPALGRTALETAQYMWLSLGYFQFLLSVWVLLHTDTFLSFL